MQKGKVVAFTICDKANEWMLPYLKNSLRKFHSEEELPLVVYGQEELDKINDPFKFYRATPLFAKKLIEEFDLVLKLDIDQIIFGRLDAILEDTDYDVGVVYNGNRTDPLVYGEIGLLTIQPSQYFNCGLVAMRSQRFIDHWFKLCDGPHFNSMPFREQGFLNILCHYGDFKVRCFDEFDPFTQTWGLYGLRSKGEGLRMKLVENGDKWDVVLPKDPTYNPKDVLIKVWHNAGGSNEPKMRYRIVFSEEIISYIDWLIKDTKEPYVRK